MRKIHILTILCFGTIFFSCTKSTDTEKYQNKRNNIQKQLFAIPTKKGNDPNRSDIVLAQAWRSFIDYNPENGILAMATQLGQVIEIYNLETDETIHMGYGKFGEPEFSTKDTYAIPNGIITIYI